LFELRDAFCVRAAAIDDNPEPIDQPAVVHVFEKHRRAPGLQQPRHFVNADLESDVVQNA
jgi:hypothetical protein